MATTTVDKLVEAAKQLNSAELDQLTTQVLALRAKRKAPSLSAEESTLLMRVNIGLPTEVHQRYQELIRKRREESLTQDEHRELLDLTDKSEQKQAERVEALVELARLRNVSLGELMDTLGIKPPAVE